MKKEDSNFKHGEAEEQKVSTDDLKFMRSAVEKTCKQVNPDTHTMVMWGLICVICYPAIYFLEKFQLAKWILPFFLSLMVFGLCYIFITWLLITKRDKKAGFIPLLREQLTWVWIIIMVFHGLTWSILGTVFNNFCTGDPGFLFAIFFSIALSITGVFHTKEWLWGGIGIFVGILLAFFIKDYAYLILGPATGLGCIIPAIIVQRNYRKQEKENA
jgi:hypothetical protein